jgi:hypothetical protein
VESLSVLDVLLFFSIFNAYLRLLSQSNSKASFVYHVKAEREKHLICSLKIIIERFSQDHQMQESNK